MKKELTPLWPRIEARLSQQFVVSESSPSPRTPGPPDHSRASYAKTRGAHVAFGHPALGELLAIVTEEAGAS